MSASPQVLTLEEANALVPRLSALMQAQMGLRTEIEQRLERLAEELGAVPDAVRVEEGDAPHVKGLKRELIARIDEYQAAWRELDDMGAVLKDPRMGLVDFYGQVDGKLVWLCWKYGEQAVTHYHGLDEGFAGRRPIEPTMRQRHLN